MKKLLILFFIILLSVNVFALTCDTPLSTLDFKGDSVVCDNATSDYCLTYVYLNNKTGGLINSYPERVVTLNGIVYGFIPEHGQVLVEFSNENIRPNYNYTYGVVCGTDTYEFNLNLSMKEASVVNDVMVWTTDNIIIVMLSLMGLVIILVILLRVIEGLRK